MQEIADWREKLGMSEYAQRFTEHKIDISVLGHLTDQDLKDIGIPLGHRRKILAAVGELTGVAATTPKPPARQEPDTQDTAERRQNHGADRRHRWFRAQPDRERPHGCRSPTSTAATTLSSPDVLNALNVNLAK